MVVWGAMHPALEKMFVQANHDHPVVLYRAETYLDISLILDIKTSIKLC